MLERYDQTLSASPDLRDMASVQEPADDTENQLLPAAIAKELNGLIDPIHDLRG